MKKKQKFFLRHRSVGSEPRGTIARKLGVRGTPLQEQEAQHAEPSKHVAGATRNGQLAPYFPHEPKHARRASQNVAGATRRVTREEQCPTRQQEPPRASESVQRGNHRDSGAKTTQGSLLERQRASRGVIIGIVVPRPRRGAS